jgi:drug/metabolite transporter (DMT)-like permease
MMIAFTIMASIGQTFMKTGADRLKGNFSLPILIGDTPLQIGLGLYICGAMFAILALRHGELSVLWPVISLSYVWVAILAVVLFHEHISAARAVALVIIIAGVALLGRGDSK